MTSHKSTLILRSPVIGTVLMVIGTELFEVTCELAEPGGVNEGGKGFPIRYHYCGAWGEQTLLYITALDILILSSMSYLVLRLVTKNK